MIQYPIDKDGFAVSYPNNDDDQWIENIKKYNVLVVPVLDDDECEKLEKDIWDSVGPKVTKDSLTWETSNWPDPDHPSLCNQYVHSEIAFETRTHPKIVKIFETLYRTSDLITTIDYYGIKRATILPSGERKDWRNKPLRLHWDCDIKQYVVDQKEKKNRFQALIACNDNDQSNGSFACVIGSANMLNDWLTTNNAESGKYVPMNNDWQKNIQRLPIKKGCIVIWDVGVAHCNYSNFSPDPRLTMYCRMIPKQIWSIKRESQTISKYWKEHPEIKKKIMGMRKWDKRQKEIMDL